LFVKAIGVPTLEIGDVVLVNNIISVCYLVVIPAAPAAPLV